MHSPKKTLSDSNGRGKKKKVVNATFSRVGKMATMPMPDWKSQNPGKKSIIKTIEIDLARPFYHVQHGRVAIQNSVFCNPKPERRPEEFSTDPT